MVVGGDIAIIATSSRSRSPRNLRYTLDLDPSLTIRAFLDDYLLKSLITQIRPLLGDANSE